MGKANEKRLVAHIQRLSAAGFAPDRTTVRTLAYKFAEKLNIQHKFSAVKEMAGFAWLQSFLERNPELSVRQAEGLSLARARGMNRQDVNEFYKLLETTLTDYELLEKPSHIFNMDETGVQLLNKAGKVITNRGSKDVHLLTSKERGENVTVIACCSADGKFIPPVLIFKGVNRKPEFSDGLPAGSKVYMNRKSSFINSELFLKWLKEQFIPHKPAGKCLLILDGHTSHSTDCEMLETADDNDIILLCLPSHCTQALQPLDRSFFRPFKAYFNQEAQLWMKNHSSRNFTRYQAGTVIGKAWIRAAGVGNAVNGFRASGIFPLDPNAIPDHFFSMLDSTVDTPNEHATSPTPEVNLPEANERLETSTPKVTVLKAGPSKLLDTSLTPKAGPSHLVDENLSPNSQDIQIESNEEIVTPSKYLSDISPIPTIPVSLNKRFKQGAIVLNSPQNILNKKEKKKKGENKAKVNQMGSLKVKRNTSVTTQIQLESEKWSDSDDEPLVKKSKEQQNKVYLCVECFEEYYKTTKKVDWMECIQCKKWLHVSCTMYGDLCNICSRENMRKIRIIS